MKALSRNEKRRIRAGKEVDLTTSELEEIDNICNPQGQPPISDKNLLDIEENVLSQLRSGKRIPIIIDWVITTYPSISKDRAKLIIDRVRIAMRSHYENYISNITEENINTLLEIRNNALNNNQKQLAIQAIDTINKMTGQYVHKEEVNVTNDQPVVIKFN